MEAFVSLSTGVLMEYVEQRRGGGLPVVFLHDVADSWRSFEHVLALLPPNIHACAISARGHGRSSRPGSTDFASDMSRDLRAFMDSRGMIRAAIVGHAMGAMVAQRFAVDHPDRVSALVLISASSPETLALRAPAWHEVFEGFLKTPDVSSALSQVSAPTLVYEGTGHTVHWEEPARFAGDLKAFLARVAEPRVLATV